MTDNPLRIFDRSVTDKWDFEKYAEYQGHIDQLIRIVEASGKPVTIEYIDLYGNVLKRFKLTEDIRKLKEISTANKK